MRCPHCQAENRDVARFCGTCGEGSAASWMTCTRCSAEVPRAPFCDQCGAAPDAPGSRSNGSTDSSGKKAPRPKGARSTRPLPSPAPPPPPWEQEELTPAHPLRFRPASSEDSSDAPTASFDVASLYLGVSTAEETPPGSTRTPTDEDHGAGPAWRERWPVEAAQLDEALTRCRTERMAVTVTVRGPRQAAIAFVRAWTASLEGTGVVTMTERADGPGLRAPLGGLRAALLPHLQARRGDGSAAERPTLALPRDVPDALARLSSAAVTQWLFPRPRAGAPPLPSLERDGAIYALGLGVMGLLRHLAERRPCVVVVQRQAGSAHRALLGRLQGLAGTPDAALLAVILDEEEAAPPAAHDVEESSGPGARRRIVLGAEGPGPQEARRALADMPPIVRAVAARAAVLGPRLTVAELLALSDDVAGPEGAKAAIGQLVEGDVLLADDRAEVLAFTTAAAREEALALVEPPVEAALRTRAADALVAAGSAPERVGSVLGDADVHRAAQCWVEATLTACRLALRDEARAFLTELEALLPRVDEPSVIVLARRAEAEVDLLEGRPADAHEKLEDLDAALAELPARAGGGAAIARPLRAVRGEALVRASPRGGAARLRALLDETEGEEEHLTVAAWLGEALHAAGDTLGAREVLERALLRARAPNAVPPAVRADALFALARVLADVGEEERALDHLETVLALREDAVDPLGFGRAAFLAGELELKARQLEAADSSLELAYGLFSGLGDERLALSVRLARAELLLRRSRFDEAKAELEGVATKLDEGTFEEERALRERLTHLRDDLVYTKKAEAFLGAR